MTNAQAALTKMAQQVAAEMVIVRREFSSLAQVQALMTKHGQRRVEDAMYEEARKRVIRKGQ